MKDSNSTTPSKDEIPVKQVDLAIILKAALALSEQLLPEKLAEILMQLIMEESGSDKGCLLLERNKQLLILAESEIKKEVEIKIYNTFKIPDYNLLPEKIITDVTKKIENIIINDVSKDKTYTSDKYISITLAKSIACIPITNDKKIIGLIYLENSHLINAFTPEKIAVLKILATQAAVSFENMILFNKLNLSKKRFQDIMDNSTAVIWAKQLNGRYLFINNEFEKIRKVTREKVIDFTDHEIFSKD